MAFSSDYFEWRSHGNWIRVGARAIIFNRARDKILVERNSPTQTGYFNFIGGGVEIGESLQECIERELTEETNARVIAATYLLVVENFIKYPDGYRHGLGHYFEVTLDRDDVRPTGDNVSFYWHAIAELRTIDLRPAGVRDLIADGAIHSVHHLLLCPS